MRARSFAGRAHGYSSSGHGDSASARRRCWPPRRRRSPSPDAGQSVGEPRATRSWQPAPGRRAARRIGNTAARPGGPAASFAGRAPPSLLRRRRVEPGSGRSISRGPHTILVCRRPPALWFMAKANRGRDGRQQEVPLAQGTRHITRESWGAKQRWSAEPPTAIVSLTRLRV